MRARVLVGLWLLAAGLASLARADVVTLTIGNELRGRVLEETDEKVVLLTAGGKLTLPRRQVASVVRDEASAAGAERRPLREPASPGLHEEADDELLASSSDEPWVEQE